MFGKSFYKEESQSSILKEMLDLFGYCKSANIVKGLDLEIRSAADNALKRSLQQHYDLHELGKRMSSEVCCPVDEDFSASALQSYLRKFYELSINKGHNAQEIHTNVSKLKTSVFAEFRLTFHVQLLKILLLQMISSLLKVLRFVRT